MRLLWAFIITIIIYILLILAYLLYFKPVKIIHKKPKDEHIIKIDIRDIPRYAKKIEPKKEIKQRVKKRPVPKKIIPKKPPQKKIVKAVKSEVSTPKKPKPKPPTPILTPIIEEIFEEVEFIEETVQEVIIEEPLPKPNEIIAEEDMLYIPNPMITTPNTTTQTDTLSSLLGQSSPVSSSQKSPLIQKLYGSSFDSFTPVQKKFIVDNLGGIHRITQSTLTRRGYPAGAIAYRTGQEGENIVSFDLHPNGNISNLRLEQRVGYHALDENTLQTIKIAYKDYPYPDEITHIIFYVEYSIFGY